MIEETKRYKTEMAKIDFKMAQLEREKRLEQAARHPGQLSAGVRSNQKKTRD